jgi:hypothetical protein
MNPMDAGRENALTTPNPTWSSATFHTLAPPLNSRRPSRPG